ncbi:MAG: nitroreductase family protein [Eubacteriales bacterium]|nr:nitroreductase family protein [Eubacteriales bacterium]
MDLQTAIQERFSYRGKYLNTPVPHKDLRLLLEAGLAAPSGCNKQTTSLIALEDSLLVKQVAALMEKPNFASAPAAICVLTQRIIAYRDRTYYVQDYAAAIENILLTATAMGYASCWVEGHITDADRIGRRMADMLGVPQDRELVAYLPIGVPAEKPVNVQKKPFDERAWFNGYGKTEEN